MNVGLIQAFAGECARRGGDADRLLAAMLALQDDVAPYGHVDEILPILAVAALGARAASDPQARGKLLEQLEEAACDRTRFRVRDTVATGLVQIGIAVGVPFAAVLQRWAEDEQPFLAHAVALAMVDGELLAAIGEVPSTTILDSLLARVSREHRAGRRHDAFRRLCKVLESTPGAIVARYPQAADVLIRHAVDQDEDVRAIIAHTATVLRKTRAGDRSVAIEAALTQSKKPLRDPRHGRLPGKRGRGKH